VAGQHDQGTTKMWTQFAVMSSDQDVTTEQIANKMTSCMDQFRAF